MMVSFYLYSFISNNSLVCFVVHGRGVTNSDAQPFTSLFRRKNNNQHLAEFLSRPTSRSSTEPVNTN